jgi:hypothetical protein
LKAVADRILELRKEMECGDDRFFNHLNSLDVTIVDQDHEYLIAAIEAGVKEFRKYRKLAAKVIRQIRAQKRTLAPVCRDITTGREIKSVKATHS